MKKIFGILNGDYFLFLKSKKKGNVNEEGLPESLSAWATARRLGLEYGWKI